MGDVAAVEAPLGHGIIVERAVGDKRRRVLARLGQQGRNVRQIVLAVGIHLQGVAEAECMGAAQPVITAPPLPWLWGWRSRVTQG